MSAGPVARFLDQLPLIFYMMCDLYGYANHKLLFIT